MTRETIAFDIDDVVADTTEALRLFVNEHTGLNLTKEDYKVPATYWGYYEHVWTGAGLTDHSWIHKFHEGMGINQDNIRPVEGAVPALTRIARKKDVVGVTSRELFMEDATYTWINRLMPGVFKDLVLLGHVDTANQTKGDACLAVGASLLFDDNFGHCKSAEAVGVEPALLGDRGWHHEHAEEEITRCKDWPAVVEFLDARS
jgi:FMN phosphatase YigB (HAD superfamily)